MADRAGSECVTCTQPAHEAFLCSRCGHQLAVDLDDVAGLLTGARGDPLDSLAAELATTRYRLDAVAARSPIGRDADKPLPWKEPAADAAWVLADTLVAWARDLAGIRGVLLDAHTVAEVATWLARRVDWIRQHPRAGQAHDEITNAVRNARRAVDRPANRARFEVGPCPEQDADGARCPGRVWAYIPTREEDPAVLRCARCEAEWDTTRWLRVGTRILRLLGQPAA